MPALDSDKVRRALLSKMGADEDKSRKDRYYTIRDIDGRVIGSPSISHGAREPLGPKRVLQMARQMHLDSAEQLIDLVDCPLSRDNALAIMRGNWPPGSSRLIQR